MTKQEREGLEGLCRQYENCRMKLEDMGLAGKNEWLAWLEVAKDLRVFLAANPATEEPADDAR